MVQGQVQACLKSFNVYKEDGMNSFYVNKISRPLYMYGCGTDVFEKSSPGSLTLLQSQQKNIISMIPQSKGD